ncbi:hypothetical protein SAMN02983003_2972 [Devosia enhydra]|uniref:VOC domain-containing protein n=1 Tax=Devosia enhydra TaxID=665118 RepID=A0A1K2I099_9HYPH|nr:glyoxalase/bleomycin resistance/extradiol dioxygenase family protein [Devosia enhydra]SFZ85802.1 hypothetical protein SAMN02983003_2972 [Devosia enhydra]
MPLTAKIDYLELPSAAPSDTARFFSDVFGWSTIDYGPDYKGAGGAGIDTGIDGASDRVAAPLPVIRTDDLEAVEALVIAAGGEITRPAFDFPGGRRFHMRVPGGFEMAVYVARD